MTAAWVAVEDIAPDAGRFFVYAKSHLIVMAEKGETSTSLFIMNVTKSS
jgi:ectoine hydroxylase-related dioxygenase (phytanoyl-CoA dioxygenase family)